MQSCMCVYSGVLFTHTHPQTHAHKLGVSLVLLVFDGWFDVGCLIPSLNGSLSLVWLL